MKAELPLRINTMENLNEITDKRLTMCDYILSIGGSKVTIQQLKKLKGADIPVKIEKREWRAMVLKVDQLIITSITANVDILENKIEGDSIIIYCDFILEGRLIYNTWVGLNAIKRHISNGRLNT